MSSLFTVRWPLFARLEAVLLFPVSVILASELAVVGRLVNDKLVPAVLPVTMKLGLAWTDVVWGATAVVVVLPYLMLMIVADRLLTVRKGYALLSFVAITGWTMAAHHLSDRLLDITPHRFVVGLTRPFEQEVALLAVGTALLLHLWPLWVGLRDDGDVATRLLNPGGSDRLAYVDEVRSWKASDFRGQQRHKQVGGLASGPREAPLVKVIYAVTWVGVMSGIMIAYRNWDDLTAGRLTAPHVADGAANGAAPVIPIAPPPSRQPEARAVPPSPMPSVQRPGELRASLAASGADSGPNEAIAARGPDGSFGFDAEVNGLRVSMLFDTGATVVALRAEDAARLGINLSRLNYSAKVKTANGTADVAPIVIETMTVGNITQRNVSGFVARQGMLQENLLGQTFLTRLSGYSVENNRLVLRGR